MLCTAEHQPVIAISAADSSRLSTCFNTQHREEWIRPLGKSLPLTGASTVLRIWTRSLPAFPACLFGDRLKSGGFLARRQQSCEVSSISFTMLVRTIDSVFASTTCFELETNICFSSSGVDRAHRSTSGDPPTICWNHRLTITPRRMTARR